MTGAAIDKDKSTIDIAQVQAVADGQDEVSISVTLRDAQGNALISRGVTEMLTSSPSRCATRRATRSSAAACSSRWTVPATR